MLESEVCEDWGLIYVYGDLFDAALSRYVLSTCELRAAANPSETDEVPGDQRYSAPGALLPRRVGRRVNDDLPEDSPTRVVRITARNQKPCERLCHSQCFRLRAMAVEMPQRRPDIAAVLDRPGELTGGLAGLA